LAPRALARKKVVVTAVYLTKLREDLHRPPNRRAPALALEERDIGVQDPSIRDQIEGVLRPHLHGADPERSVAPRNTANAALAHGVALPWHR
jgi:hypothetical protein